MRFFNTSFLCTVRFYTSVSKAEDSVLFFPRMVGKFLPDYAVKQQQADNLQSPL